MSYRRHADRETLRHTDDWLMTYADMITLLLCFFAIFLSVSVSRKDVPQKLVVAQSIPLPAQRVDLVEDDRPVHAVEPAIPAPEAAPPKTTARIEEPPAATAAVVADVPSRTAPGTSHISPPEILQTLKTQGAAKIEQEGDRITTLEINSAAFFDSGSATLSNAGESILRAISAKLKWDELRDYRITVEGHTDDSPISTARFPSNWELSTARASAVVHFFLDQGIPARKLRAAGYADTFPKVPNRDANGAAIPANQAQNRRVVIQLEKIDKAERGSDTAANDPIPPSVLR
jgi:chemotaxis protein MotB